MKTLTRREQLEKLTHDMKAFADEMDAKSAANGNAAPEQADMEKLLAMGVDVANATKAYREVASAHTSLNDAQSLLTQLGDLRDAPEGAVKGFLDVARTDDGRIARPGANMTLGQLYVESEAYKGFNTKYTRAGVIPDSTKGIQSDVWSSKALITGLSATSAGAAVRNDIYIPITDLVPFHELTLLDLVTKGTTVSDSVDYVKITGKTNSAATVAEATSVSNGAKPESAITMSVQTAAVRTLAHWIPITKRAAADFGQVRTMVDAFLVAGLQDVIETQMMTGDGTGENFLGIMNSSPLTVGSAGTDLDAIVDAIAAIRVTGRNKPTALVIHPNDWYSTGFLTAKDANGNYLIGDPNAGVEARQTLWGLNVVVTEAITQNTCLVGDFRKAIFWEREPISVIMTDSHSDFFIRNILVILAECRAAFTVLDNEAFCTVTAV